MAVALLGAGCTNRPGVKSESCIPEGHVPVPVVRNTGPLRRPTDGWTVDTSRSWKLASVTGPSPIGVESVSFLSGDRIAVADPFESRVVVFDRNGREVATFGNSGRGPAEFASLDLVERHGPDSVVTYDNVMGRATIWSLDGIPGRHVLLSRLLPARVTRWLTAAGDGLLLFTAIEPDMTPRAGVTRIPLPILTEVTGQGPEVLLVLPGFELFADGKTPAAVPVIFGERTIFAAKPGALFAAVSSDYSICEYSLPQGRLQRVITRIHRPKRASPAEVRQRREELRERYAGLPGSMAEVYDQLVRQVPARPELPLLRKMKVDPTGHLWVLPETASSSGREIWDVFDPRGRWSGSVEMASGGRLVGVGHARIAVSFTDGTRRTEGLSVFPLVRGR